MPVYFDNVPIGLDPSMVYAGINMPINRIPYFSGTSSLGPSSDFLPFVDIPPPVARVGSVIWPMGSARYGLGCFLATQEEVVYWRNDAYNNGTSAFKTLKVSDGTDYVNLQMRMLPPIPLSQIFLETNFGTTFQNPTTTGAIAAAGSNFTSLLTGASNITNGSTNLWLMLFVDIRYFFWQRFLNLSDLNTPNDWTWSQLYTRFADNLGVTITAETPHAYYGTGPTNRMKGTLLPAPIALEAAARMAGQKVAVNYDGTISIYNAQTALNYSDSLWSDFEDRVVAFGGGRLRIQATNASGSGSTSASATNYYNSYDQIGLLPEYVDVHFQRQRDGALTREAYRIEVRLVDHLPPEVIPTFTGAGTGNRQQLVGELYAESTGNSDVPDNLTDLTNYANQFAADWVRWQLSATHAAFAGVCNVQPSPLEDIEWNYTMVNENYRVVTRVVRPPLNDRQVGDVAPPMDEVCGSGSGSSHGSGSASGACCRSHIGNVPISVIRLYRTGVKQALFHDENGCLYWQDVTTCPAGSGSASPSA